MPVIIKYYSIYICISIMQFSLYCYSLPSIYLHMEK